MLAGFLDSQVSLYEQQSGELGAWMQSHLENMQCQGLQDLIGFGLLTLDGIKRHNRQWTDSVRSGQTEFSWADSEHFAKVYLAWLRATLPILEVASRCEQRSCELERLDELRSAFEDVSLMSLDAQRLKSSVESLEQGRGIPHAKAMNDLRDSLRRTRI
jgi:hypothetical protein